MRKMLNMKQIELAKQYAIGAVFTDTAEMGYSALVEELSQDNIPEEVIVYQPYENLDPQELLEVVEEQYDIFEMFAEDVVKVSE